MKKYLKPLSKKIQSINYQSKSSRYFSKKNIDAIIIAIGAPHFFKPHFMREDTGIIDIGITQKGKNIFGDVDPKCYKKSSFYTPVPGGVGPITVAKLLENVYKLFMVQFEKKPHT